MKKVTACTMDCPDSCSLVVKTKKEGTISIQGNPHHPITAGFTCAKIKKHPERLFSPHRITSPMIKKSGKWQKISWGSALDLCGEKMNALRSEPERILHCHGEGAKGILKQLNKLFFAKLGATRTNGSLCDAAGFIAGLMDFGSRINNDILDIHHTRAIVNWGKDFLKSSIHTHAMIKKARKEQDAKLLTVSPFMDTNTDAPNDKIFIKPGTDRFLAAAVIKKLMAMDRVQPDILENTHHWETFRTILDRYSLMDLCRACDVSFNDLDKLTGYYTLDRPVTTFIGTGLQRYAYGGENVRFINALALLSGNVGQSGGGVYFHLHSLANLNTDWAAFQNSKSRRALPVAALGKSILETGNPPIEMIWINGSNVLNQAPDSFSILQAFENVPFKVVVDAFMTDTAQHADLFLPAALMLEQEDIVGSYLHHYVHFVDQVLDPPGEAKSDDWILYELAKRLDPPIHLPDKNEIFNAAINTPHLNISLDALKKQKFVKARRPRVVYENLTFDHPDGKYRLPLGLHAEALPPPGYPLRLLSLIRNSAMHSQMLPEDHHMPLEVLVSPNCPALDNLDLNKDIWLTSSVGQLKIKIKLSPNLHPHTVVAPRGTWISQGGGLNQLVQTQLTDIGKGAAFYAQYVTLENR